MITHWEMMRLETEYKTQRERRVETVPIPVLNTDVCNSINKWGENTYISLSALRRMNYKSSPYWILKCSVQPLPCKGWHVRLMHTTTEQTYVWYGRNNHQTIRRLHICRMLAENLCNAKYCQIHTLQNSIKKTIIFYTDVFGVLHKWYLVANVN
jgi:hypothetical protein